MRRAGGPLSRGPCQLAWGNSSRNSNSYSNRINRVNRVNRNSRNNTNKNGNKENQNQNLGRWLAVVLGPRRAQ